MSASRRRALFAVTPCVVMIAIVTSVGCSSSEFQTAPVEDVGASDGTTDTTAVDAKPLCIFPPTVTGSETLFCDFEAKVNSRCGQCETCRQTNANGCVQFGGALSTSFKTVLDACKDVVACGEYTTYLTDPCVLPKLAASPPTKQQQAAKDAYCGACPTNPQECADFFDFSAYTGVDAGPDAGNNKGIGALVMISSDEIAKLIADECKGFANCNPGIYQLCALGKFCNRTPPDACNKGFCGK